MAAETKLVKVMLGALLRQQFCHVIEVPVDMEDSEVVGHVGNNLDGSEYEDDPEFWERGEEYTLPVEEGDEPMFKLVDGKLEPVK